MQLTDSEWEFIEPYLPVGEYGAYPERLRQLIDYDSDPFEVELYEHSSDPLIRLVDKAQRSYAGQYERRLRRLRERARHQTADQ
ncbi:hypothetical protein AB0M95_22955 [Sphaerisporangium sp. NPDC051017]|uniref:hypothetical protein n=1 Tax=Sphaerisporangium sp. NPDC051017 TaxID=3154636 RepID=UPI00342A009A